MAANDGTSAELFPGWSSVVHQPAEEPEETDLPSTVDIAALSVEPNNTGPVNDNSDSENDSEADSSNSASDASQSQSDSSDSEDSSTSSQESSSRSGHSSPSPEFSVTSSQTGLRLTIATIRKPSPTGDKNMPKITEHSKSTSKSTSSSSDSSPSSDSDSESEKSERNKNVEVKNEAKASLPVKDSNVSVRQTRRVGAKTRARVAEKKEEKPLKNIKKDGPSSSGSKPGNARIRLRGRRTRKMASLPLSRGSTYSSSDSDDSDADSAMLASCSLQEIRQEDLAAILPDQQEIDAFDFECNRTDKNSPATGDVSGSDMELPQQAVNALIQRTTESSSEGESHAPPNPFSLYANSLLQQFVAQTQLLNAPCPPMPSLSEPLEPTVIPSSSLDTQSNKPDTENVKKRRGRPKKSDNITQVEKSQEYCTNPNVSPDSGIQNSPDHVSSPEPILSPAIKQKSVPIKEETKKAEKIKTKTEKIATRTNNNIKQVPAIAKSKEINKIPVTSNRFDRVMYANADRVLYPPRRLAGRPPAGKKGPGRPPKHRPPLVADQNNVKNVEKSKENQPKSFKGKPRSVPVLSTKNAHKKNKFQTLKVPKLMHSKHKHKKHRKYKFKILKPLVATNPKVSIEIEKLIADFIKYCVIATKQQPKENVPEQILKTLKKVTKKRKTTEYAEKKKKKQSVSSTDNKVNNSNEQRLPLKKRHYHMVNSSESKEPEEVKIEPEEANKTDKPKEKVKQNVTASKVEKEKQNVTASKVEKEKQNVTASKVEKEKQNVTASKIEKEKQNVTANKVDKEKQNATASKIEKEKQNVTASKVEKEKQTVTASKIDKEKQNVTVSKVEKERQKTSTTDKPPKAETVKHPVPPRHIPVIKSNGTASPKAQNVNNNDYDLKEPTKSVIKEVKETKPVIKDTTTAVGSHIEEAIEACINRYAEGKTPETKVTERPPSSIATTPKKRHRLEMTEKLKLASVIKEEPITIKEEIITEKDKPKISIESFITELKAKRNLLPRSPEAEEYDKKLIKKVEEVIVKEQPVNDPNTKLSPESVKKKVRKRRAINRTGFPTIRRKKKKSASETSPTLPVESQPSHPCDRVPKEGEEYTKFVQRTEKSENAVLRPMTPEKAKIDDPSRWELMSECESLPQDERIYFDDDMKPDRMTLRQRDISPSTSVETRSSERSKSKPDDIENDLDVSLESSIERLRSRLEERGKRKRSREKLLDALSNYPKRKLRDTSPASSIEPLMERRLKDDRGSTSGDEKRGRRSLRWKKKYLLAGLFSDYYKEHDEAVRQKRTENASKPFRNFTYNPSEHPYGLLPPPYHCGRYLRCRKIPFQLPYDIWWQHTHSQLPGRDIVPSWNYRKIRTNIYNVKNSTGACEPQQCNCKPSTNCGDDCINRLVFSECPTSHRCQNQKIQRHEWSPGIEKFMTESKGWGVKTKLPIKNGEFILEYVGEVVADQEFKERMGTIYTSDTHHYCLHLDSGLVIDGHRMGSDGRFVNHSCNPNCEMQKWSVNGQFRMALFSLRDIEGGEELTYDYNFSLFNPAEGQECKCGSELCRGVIGGKTQRVRQLPEPAISDKKHPGRVGRPRKTEAKKKANNSKEVEKVPTATSLLPLIQVKPMSHQQKCFILEHHCFLLRNLTKVRKVRDRSLSTASAISRLQTATPTDTSAFLNQLNALQKPRNMKTRRLAQAEDDPELNKTIKLASLLKEIWTKVTSAKDAKGELMSTPFMTMPSKRKVPELYARISNPIDLSTIEQNIATGVYKTPEAFDDDFNLLFRNYIRFYGRTNEMGITATKLKKVYSDSKRGCLTKFEDTLGEKPPHKFVSNRKKSEEEDIIRCICGIPRDEGLMIQCERCMVWQHCECVKADVSAASYHCENCVPRKVDYEIPLNEFTEHGHRYYMTLMRGDLQLRQGDTVYMLRDIPIKGTNKKHTYDTIGKIEYSELDIFRIERLWKEEKTGKRLAYGHHYLRPHETFHEPTRKFFPNEVMRVPLYEAVPVELVISHCWVVDLNTYCKGRPIGASPEHIYICEYRVDKGAKMFSKVSKSKFPICTKTFAFEHFETRLKVSRTYCPHDVDESLLKANGRKHKTEEIGKTTTRDKGGGTGVGGGGGAVGGNGVGMSIKNETQNAVGLLPPIIRTPAEQKSRLNRILLNLLSKMPTKQVCDISYLLEGGRRRKKPTDNATSK